MTTSTSPKTTGELMSDVLGNVSNLVRNEADLARAEITESLGSAVSSIASMAVALALAVTGLNVLVSLLVAVLVRAGFPLHLVSLLVGASLLLVALITYTSAKSALNQIGFVPTRAARNLKRDAAAIKDSFNDK